ncbi:hypothetical protein DPEC_G00308610 [Dallia pectoralis]|uniref:Uncharacterized protein n=1 Tax=Dallia pectoralis TaxID=75939 RepID=A0ACC2FEZ8_DALPE|nr:hypothetical protein DPEC_G00308610 [Dallia pectoralis]
MQVAFDKDVNVLSEFFPRVFKGRRLDFTTSTPFAIHTPVTGSVFTERPWPHSKPYSMCDFALHLVSRVLVKTSALRRSEKAVGESQNHRHNRDAADMLIIRMAVDTIR